MSEPIFIEGEGGTAEAAKLACEGLASLRDMRRISPFEIERWDYSAAYKARALFQDRASVERQNAEMEMAVRHSRAKNPTPEELERMGEEERNASA